MTDLRRHVPPLTLVWDDEAPGALHRTVDGTLVFADVSGFTALTERLSRQGRIGAEEIVEALNRVFGPMLTIAAARGGELLKFGGDALLFLFRGEDHPEQACDAAVEMRASLRAAAAVPTSAGRFALSMSVGVHAGDIDLFLVGSPTRELLVLGPGASAVAVAEKAADAGQVVVSPQTVGRLSPGATRDRGDGALLLRRRRPRTQPAHSGIRRHDRVRPDADPLPDRAGRVPGAGPTGPGAPGRHDRLRPLLGDRCRSLTAGSDGTRRGAARAGECGRGGARGRRGHPVGHRPRHRRRQVLPRLRRAQHPRGRRGTDAAGAAPGRGCRPPPAAPARRRAGQRLRRRGRRGRSGGVLGHGRHDQHGRADHGHGSPGRRARPSCGARAVAHPVRRDAPGTVPDEGQGRPGARLRGGRGDRQPRSRAQRPAAVPRSRGRARDRASARSSGPSPARAA